MIDILKLYNFIIDNCKDKYKESLSNTQLNDLCMNRFKKYIFTGVYPADKIPSDFYNNINEKKISCICNTDDSTKGGAHWIALIRDKNNKSIVYDSFGRMPGDLNNIYFSKKWRTTDKNPEQYILESNCGLRCVAFLIICEIYDIDSILKVL
jgi:hypothetical protein